MRMILGRRSLLVGTLLFGCKPRVTIDPEIAAWLGEPGSAPTPNFGLALCWLRYRIGGIWPCVLAHNLHNVALMVLG